MSARIEPAAPPFPEEIQVWFDRLMPRGVPPLQLFAVMAKDARLFRRFMEGGLLDKGNLTLRQREIVIDRVTARCGAQYEWGVHVALFGVRVRFTDEQIYSLVHGDADDVCWTDEAEKALIDACDALHESCTLGDEIWTDLSGRFSEAAMIELLMLAGSYRMVSYLVNALNLSLETYAARFPAK
jgi:alkylhydroperoxidase family enzyme